MRREKERIQVSMGIVLESASGNREARISDLSMGGCFIDSIATFREGEIVQFKLSLSEEQTEDMSGEVAYVLEGIGFGVQFTGLSEEQHLLLSQIILAHGGTP